MPFLKRLAAAGAWPNTNGSGLVPPASGFGGADVAVVAWDSFPLTLVAGLALEPSVTTDALVVAPSTRDDRALVVGSAIAAVLEPELVGVSHGPSGLVTPVTPVPSVTTLPLPGAVLGWVSALAAIVALPPLEFAPVVVVALSVVWDSVPGFDVAHAQNNGNVARLAHDKRNIRRGMRRGVAHRI